jgi:hypothetical protein
VYAVVGTKTFNWTVDTSAPAANITSAPATTSAQPAGAFQFTSTETGTFQCRVDDGPWGACSRMVHRHEGSRRRSHRKSASRQQRPDRSVRVRVL